MPPIATAAGSTVPDETMAADVIGCLRDVFDSAVLTSETLTRAPGSARRRVRASRARAGLVSSGRSP